MTGGTNPPPTGGRTNGEESELTELMVLVLLLVIAPIVLGITGAVAKGLLYLLIIGVVVVVVFLIAMGPGALAGHRPTNSAAASRVSGHLLDSTGTLSGRARAPLSPSWACVSDTARAG